MMLKVRGCVTTISVRAHPLSTLHAFEVGPWLSSTLRFVIKAQGIFNPGGFLVQKASCCFRHHGSPLKLQMNEKAQRWRSADGQAAIGRTMSTISSTAAKINQVIGSSPPNF